MPPTSVVPKLWQNAMPHFGGRQAAATVFTAVTFNARVTISAGAVACIVASERSSVMVVVFACVMPLLDSVVVTDVSLGASMAVISTIWPMCVFKLTSNAGVSV